MNLSRNKPYRKSKGSGHKTVSKSNLTGDRGIAFIHGVVSSMDLMWVENKGAADVGIDGWIELSDPANGRALNSRIFVQSKSGHSWFKAESDSSFEFLCSEADLDYWLSGDAPVILVVSRDGREGYWKSLKEYFHDAKRRASRKILFDKIEDKFEPDSRSKLLSVENIGIGTYLDPVPKSENLYSNLVPVSLAFESVYIGKTLAKSQAEFDRAVSDFPGQGTWAIYDDFVISTVDLKQSAFRRVVEDGTVEEWSIDDLTENRELQPRVTQLLNRLLQQFLEDFRVHSVWKKNFYYFKGSFRNDSVAARTFRYQSYKESTSREVVVNISNNDRFPCWRHSAAYISFKAISGQWFAVIVPSYEFTSDGYHYHDKRSERLKKIKNIERNRAVSGQTRMWGDLLEFNQRVLEGVEPLIKFGRQLRFTVPVGIEDKDWKPSAQASDSDTEIEKLGGLFDED